MMETISISNSGIVTHTTSKNYKPLWISFPFSIFNDGWIEVKTKQYKKLRKRDKSCYFCGKDFDKNEKMGLIALKGRTNELACESCVDKVHKHTGLPIITPKRPAVIE